MNERTRSLRGDCTTQSPASHPNALEALGLAIAIAAPLALVSLILAKSTEPISGVAFLFIAAVFFGWNWFAGVLWSDES